MLTLHRKSSKDSGAVTTIPAAGPLNTKISNLFHTFDRYSGLTFDDLVDTLANDDEVKNLFMFAEALYLWMNYNVGHTIICSSELLMKIVTAKQRRGWATIPRECFRFYLYSNPDFFHKWRECEGLFVSDNQKLAHVIACHNPAEIRGAQMLVIAENKLTFLLSEREYDIANCKREGKCGFILKTTPPTQENPDLFDIKLCVDHSEYPPGIHFHEDIVRAENMHFMMEYPNYGWDLLPLSWWGKPVLSNSDKKWYLGTFKMDNQLCRIKVLLTSASFSGVES